jgi:hypothetical protein
VAGQVALRVVALVGVVLAPLEATGGQLVGRQRAGSGSEGTVKRENRLKPVHTFLPKIVDFVPKLCVKNWSQHFFTRINFLQKKPS